MDEKKACKVSLSTVLLIFAILVIIVMGWFIYKLNNEKTLEAKKSQELQTQVASLTGELSDLQGKIDTISNTINSNNNTASIKPSNIDSSELLSKSEIQSILGPDKARFCIEDITKDGEGYVITAYMLETNPRELSNKEYEDLLNGKEIEFRNQKWRINQQNAQDEYRVYIKSGDDTLIVEKEFKVINNLAGADAQLCDYSNKKIAFKVSKNILIGAYYSNFKYDKNGQIKAYGIEGSDEEDREITNSESLTFEKLKELSKGCKGTYDECVAYVKDGVVNAIKIFEK